MKVELVAKTKGLGKYSELDDEEIVSAIARHGIIKEDNGKLVKYLMDNKHVSPLDMINYVFEIETSLSIGRQLLRHSSIKPQEHSLRYSKSIGFEPVELRKQAENNRQSSEEIIYDIWDETNRFHPNKRVKECLHLIETVYNELLAAGVAKECARFILPNCTTTVMTFNGTLRSWITMLNVRMDGHAQKECRQIAELIGEELEKHLPNVFSRIEWRKGMFI